MKTILLLIGFVIGSIDFTEAQQLAKVTRIGYLSALSPVSSADTRRASDIGPLNLRLSW